MNIAHEKLPGLDRERVLAVVEPVLIAHRVECVELVWRTDRGGWLLEVTIERPDTRVPGEGVTIDLCSDVSRDLSAALDVADCIPHHYTLEVGSPGVERALYNPRDYERFAGQGARVKLKTPLASQYVLSGTLHGLDESGRVLLETERSELVNIELETIDSARLIFQWKKPGAPAAHKANQRRTAGHGRHAPRPQRSR
ncbi:MAG TPA: ribosome maturation factor RimP [Polyangiaceae bacterium]|jgi:ribosome maturation factor RimP